MTRSIAALGLSLLAASCGGRARGEASESMKVTSSAFQEGGGIPVRYTCDGDDVSPPLQWTGAPSTTQAYALIVDDPDAPRGTWVHWVVADIPGEVRELGEDASRTNAGGGVQGTNDFQRVGWGGPCPPAGPAHRYVFEVYALDRPLGLERGVTKRELTAEMDGHVLARAQLVGRYARARR